jgi:hypothetical protein
LAVTGDQYTYVALAASTRAIISYRTGKRDSDNLSSTIRLLVLDHHRSMANQNLSQRREFNESQSH